MINYLLQKNTGPVYKFNPLLRFDFNYEHLTLNNAQTLLIIKNKNISHTKIKIIKMKDIIKNRKIIYKKKEMEQGEKVIAKIFVEAVLDKWRQWRQLMSESGGRN